MTYKITCEDGAETEIDAGDIKSAKEQGRMWIREREWRNCGASVSGTVCVIDDQGNELEVEHLTVYIEPHHVHLTA